MPETFADDFKRMLAMPLQQLESIARAGQQLATILDRQGGACFMRRLVRQFASITPQPVELELPKGAEMIETALTLFTATGMRNTPLK
jgi:hypothetical protein